jgi:glycosyltransferase involved in cell wall biosynthesis
MMNDTHRGTARAEGIARLIKRQLIHMFDAALVAGSPQRRYFESMGMSPRSIFEGYDVVDNQHYEKGAADARVDPEVTRHSLRLPSQYFLNVGRMEPKKDLPTLIQAYAAARTLHKAFPKLVLVGSGGQEGALHEMCRALKLTSVDFHAIGEGAVSEAMADVDVYFYGFRQAAVLPRFYAFASAFILPSRREEWGLVVNEALASGVPVICSTSVGAAENIVKDEVTGLQFKAGDVKGLAAHLSFIYGNPEKARAMGKAAVAIMREWGPDRFAKGALEAIEYASCGKRK